MSARHPGPDQRRSVPSHASPAENSGETATRRAPGRPFTPGQSGNPGGRPREAAEVRELAQRHGPEAIERLVALMRDGEERVAVRAAEALLDRAVGRPMQAVDLSTRAAGMLDEESTEVLLAMRDECRRRVAAAERRARAAGRSDGQVSGPSGRVE